MAELAFYEKSGCINNRKQKEILRQLGHVLMSMISSPRLGRRSDSARSLPINPFRNGLITPRRVSNPAKLHLIAWTKPQHLR